MDKVELLAPAGNFSKLKTAVYFGADAVYVGGKSLSLRALSDNFTKEELKLATEYVHQRGKKIYVTVNIFAKNADMQQAEEYFIYLQEIAVDAVIISDPGLVYLCKQVAPKLKIHLSTQANTTNKYSARFWAEQGLERIILARELSLKEVKEIRDYLPKDIQIEAFIHGAMCISYSGRCLMSNYFNGRDSNRGACVQACRWEYEIREKSKEGEYYPIQQDDRGTYIMNSKDLNMMNYIPEMINAGVCSFKIEGRMKSEYYLATVINAYRRAIDEYYKNGEEYRDNPLYYKELLKTAHRVFTTAYMLGDNQETVNYDNSQSAGESVFTAVVLDYDEETSLAKVEMRNRFKVGDVLEVLSPSSSFNKQILVKEMSDTEGNAVEDAKLVQQVLFLKTDVKLSAGDILRKS